MYAEWKLAGEGVETTAMDWAWENYTNNQTPFWKSWNNEHKESSTTMFLCSMSDDFPGLFDLFVLRSCDLPIDFGRHLVEINHCEIHT